MWQWVQQHDWQAPLVFAARFASDDMALLHTGLQEKNARQSFLLLSPIEAIEVSHWADLPSIPQDAPADLPYYVGYLGYGLRLDGQSQLMRGGISPVDMPDALLIRYARLFRFDHAHEVIEEFRHPGAGPDPSHEATMRPLTDPGHHRNDGLEVGKFHSNFTRDTYESTVAETIARIEAGDFYQANITRKFYGAFSHAPDYFSLFTNLCELSPAPYSAYIRHGSRAIISSSPECFLHIDAIGKITTRPIKGSAARASDMAEDAIIQQTLVSSEKNLGENLMIVDLMRHDIAQVSEVGSVRVTEQSALHSYRTIHHLISTITAQKMPDITAFDVARACFPPGSMTGAPKLAAMRWCEQVERLERGVYSGALGWFGGGDTCHLSVVIRTLICEGDRFEFQVGGGIVADSTPEDEWKETLAKAKALAQLLAVDINHLKIL